MTELDSAPARAIYAHHHWRGSPPLLLSYVTISFITFLLSHSNKPPPPPPPAAAMEITIEDTTTRRDAGYLWYDDYTIYVGHHRILIVCTDSPDLSRKWLEGVYNKSHGSNTKHGILVISLSAWRYPQGIWTCMWYHCTKESDCQYNLIKLCVGAHCLFYSLRDTRDSSKKPFPDDYNHQSKMHQALNDLLSGPNVITVGINMTSLAKDLKRLNGLYVSNPVDLNVMAAKVMPVTEKLDLERCYDLDRLAKAVLGKKLDVIRPEPAGNRYRWRYRPMLSNEAVKNFTVDTYLGFLIANKLLDLTNGSIPADCSPFTENKKKKKKKKSK